MKLIVCLIQPDINQATNSHIRSTFKPRFKLKVNIESNHNGDVTEITHVHLDWGGQSKTPLLNFLREILKQIGHRLYIRSPHISGKISPRSTVNGFTEVLIHGNLFKSHPCYTKKGSWYDWAYFRWYGFEEPIAARILIIIDIIECEILNHMDQDPDTLPDDAHLRIIPHLTQEKWVVLLAAESP